MKRLAVLVACLMLVGNTAMANSTFSKFWKEKYAGDGCR